MATDVTALTTATSSAGRQGPRQFQGVFDVIPFKTTITDATLPAGLASEGTVTVNGAAVGDIVLCGGAVDYDAAQLTGYVSAANTVTLSYLNLDSTDANTALSAGVVVKGVVLKPKDNIWATLD
jgi:hypothetical protein